MFIFIIVLPRFTMHNNLLILNEPRIEKEKVLIYSLGYFFLGSGMGYRLYLGEMDKKIHVEIKDMRESQLKTRFPETVEHIYDDKYIFNMRKLPYTRIFQFGKYHELPVDIETLPPVFTRNLPSMNDNDFCIVDKDLLAKIIERHRKLILESHKTAVEDPEEAQLVINNLINEFRTEFSVGSDKIYSCELRAYNLDFGDEVTRSVYYIFNIFELVRIYKTFDWDKKIMIYYGW